MKTERRHELQTNELADWIGRQIEFVGPYGKVILGIGVVSIALIAAIKFMSASQQRRQANGWTEYFAASTSRDIQDLRDVAEKYSGTPASLWARQSMADLQLTQGATTLFTDRDTAGDLLKNAQDAYLEVYQQTNEDLLKQRSQFGLAQTYESLNLVSRSVDEFKKITDTWPDSAIGKLANKRHAALTKRTAKEFYDWFFAQQPKIASPTGINGLDGLGTLSDEPDIEIPSMSISEDDSAALESNVFEGAVDASSTNAPSSETSQSSDAEVETP